ncbi:hypothetical protein HY933_02945 [Candidatus Falkowbacteria bacterium]|nr:hypothetical protein [Candidatus Falkowbacteria bacterium]
MIWYCVAAALLIAGYGIRRHRQRQDPLYFVLHWGREALLRGVYLGRYNAPVNALATTRPRWRFRWRRQKRPT